MSDSDSGSKNSAASKRIVSTRSLIGMVRERRCLWDRACPGYRDRLAKDKAWSEIYSQFEPSYDKMKTGKRHMIGGYITKKWYNVRDSYAKSRKNRNCAKPYLYADMLTFLDPIYDSLGDKSFDKKFGDDRLSNDEDENEGEESENWLNEVFVDAEGNVSEMPKKPKLEYPHSRSPNHTFSSPSQELNGAPNTTHETEENVVAVLANLIRKEDDEDRAFFKSITPAVKGLSESAKFMFRIQVMKLINSLKKRESQTKSERVRIDSDSE